jgi:ABC-type multidrug transport system fused ATPase/permease subunit
MEHGRIAEFGSHRELMQLDKQYAALYNMQAKRYLEPLKAEG